MPILITKINGFVYKNRIFSKGAKFYISNKTFPNQKSLKEITDSGKAEEYKGVLKNEEKQILEQEKKKEENICKKCNKELRENIEKYNDICSNCDCWECERCEWNYVCDCIKED